MSFGNPVDQYPKRFIEGGWGAKGARAIIK